MVVKIYRSSFSCLKVNVCQYCCIALKPVKCLKVTLNPCPSLVICAVPTSVKTTPELSGPAFDEELEDRGKPGWERLRMICAGSTLAWRRQDGALWVDRHGVYSWMWLRPRDTLQRKREYMRKKLLKLVRSKQNYCSNKHAYFSGPPWI